MGRNESWQDRNVPNSPMNDGERTFHSKISEEKGIARIVNYGDCKNSKLQGLQEW